MSYDGISIRETLDKINAATNGWFLPQVQRQYVWGARHESEGYVCLLLDSLLKRWPIGGIVLWETEQRVPYRLFLGDYAPGQFSKQVDEGRWGAQKSLVYDGQQRLQTLYSVLRHRFNGRILHYDLLFDAVNSESDETGFLFRDANAPPDPRYLRMTEISSLNCKDEIKVELEERSCADAEANGNTQEKKIIRKNISALWNIFVDTNIKSLAFFPVKADTPKEVNEVFRRLNTGGVALTQLELVLGKIKAVQSDYEERLWALADQIQMKSGIEFSSTNILQFFHLLAKNTIRIDEGRLSDDDISAFQEILKNDTDALTELFSGYFGGLFNINHSSIIPRWLAILPIAAYLTERKRHNHEWRIRAFKNTDLQLIHQYFLLSQFCDWNTQTMVNAFAREASLAGANGDGFPLENIRKIAVQNNRTGELSEDQLRSQTWLAAKILMRNRKYIFHDKKPQVDHIFPVNLAEQDENYKNAVDILWNFQPMPAEVNNYKRARHPHEFFNSGEGQKYLGFYDFLPNIDSPLWKDPVKFVEYRKERMISQLNEQYGLTLMRTESSELTI